MIATSAAVELETIGAEVVEPDSSSAEFSSESPPAAIVTEFSSGDKVVVVRFRVRIWVRVISSLRVPVTSFRLCKTLDLLAVLAVLDDDDSTSAVEDEDDSLLPSTSTVVGSDS